MLQTLAIVAKRSHELLPEMAALARRTDRELRAWLFGGSSTDDDFATMVKAAARDIGVLFDIEVSVSVVGDEVDVEVGPRVVQAAAGVVREAVTNAAKHAHDGVEVVRMFVRHGATAYGHCVTR